MIIKELTLFTNALEVEKTFYKETLGFELVENTSNHFSLQVGFSKLTFQHSDNQHRYHYCFLIPANQLNDAIKWLKSRLTIVEIEKNRIVQRFETWNADSIYFYDASGNLAEFIVRYDLENEQPTEFTTSSIISVNEIGVATDDVQGFNEQLEKAANTFFWKGDLKRFGTNGDQNGLFLLPNYHLKTTWFPTDLNVEPTPFRSLIVSQEKTYQIEYDGEKLNISPNNS